MKDKIKEILLYSLGSVYCDTCSGETCQGCYRKNMHWQISEDFAESLAEEILNLNNK